jgi:hypothetical protein
MNIIYIDRYINVLKSELFQKIINKNKVPEPELVAHLFIQFNNDLQTFQPYLLCVVFSVTNRDYQFKNPNANTYLKLSHKHKD